MVMALATGWGGVCLNETDEVISLWVVQMVPLLVFRPATGLLHNIPWILHTPQWTHEVILPALQQRAAFTP